MKVEKRRLSFYLGQGFGLVTLSVAFTLFAIANLASPAHVEKLIWSRPAFDLADLSHEERFHFQMPTIDLGMGRIGTDDYRFGIVKPEARSGESLGALADQPPQVSKLSVALKGKNKAIANFEVTDPDGDLGKSSGISILLFDSNAKGVVAVRDGGFLLFGDTSIFRKPLDFTGETTGTFPFTLKGIRSFPSASIWVSDIRDNAGNMNLAPASAGIVGRAGMGSAPQIVDSNAAIFQNDDVVGVNLDGTDSDGDTVAINLAFLDATGRVVFVLGMLNDQGERIFAPFPLELLLTPVRGQTKFNVNFSLSGISKEVKPGTLRSVAVSLLDSNGNRSEVKIVPLSTSVTFGADR